MPIAAGHRPTARGSPQVVSTVGVAMKLLRPPPRLLLCRSARRGRARRSATRCGLAVPPIGSASAARIPRLRQSLLSGSRATRLLKAAQLPAASSGRPRRLLRWCRLIAAADCSWRAWASADRCGAASYKRAVRTYMPTTLAFEPLSPSTHPSAQTRRTAVSAPLRKS